MQDNDLISRQAAITSLTFAKETGRMSCGELKGVIEVLNRLPSAQPTQSNTSNTLESLDCIDRQAAIYALDGEIKITGRTNAEAVKAYVTLVKDRLERLPSTQPEIIHCRDCANYQTDWIPYAMPNGHYCSVVDTFMREDEFCSRAERREGEQDA